MVTDMHRQIAVIGEGDSALAVTLLLAVRSSWRHGGAGRRRRGGPRPRGGPGAAGRRRARVRCPALSQAPGGGRGGRDHLRRRGARGDRAAARAPRPMRSCWPRTGSRRTSPARSCSPRRRSRARASRRAAGARGRRGCAGIAQGAGEWARRRGTSTSWAAWGPAACRRCHAATIARPAGGERLGAEALEALAAEATGREPPRTRALLAAAVCDAAEACSTATSADAVHSAPWPAPRRAGRSRSPRCPSGSGRRGVEAFVEPPMTPRERERSPRAGDPDALGVGGRSAVLHAAL